MSEEPLSPSNVTTHVIVMLIVLAGGCIIEWIKSRYHPPFATSAVLGMGELVMFVYMLGSLGRACRWTYNEWMGKPTIVRGHKEGLLKQFLPQKVDLMRVLQRDSVRLPLAILLALAVIFVIFEWLTPNVQDSQLVLQHRVRALSYPSVTEHVPGLVWLEFFNKVSSPLLVIFGVLGAAIIILIIVTIAVSKRSNGSI